VDPILLPRYSLKKKTQQKQQKINDLNKQINDPPKAKIPSLPPKHHHNPGKDTLFYWIFNLAVS